MKIAIGSFVLAAVIGKPALAADMPAPPPVITPVYGWTGFYAGGNVGYSWGYARTDIAGTGGLTTFPPIAEAVIPSSFALTDSDAARLKGAVGGVEIGYNYQFNPRWVVGFETDFQDSTERGSKSVVDQFSTTACTFESTLGSCIETAPLVGTVATGYEGKITWFGTVRGRVGYLITNQILLYGTGGLAYGRVEMSGTTTAPTAAFTGFSTPFTPSSGAFSAAKTNVGYTVGGGVEGKLLSWLPANWTSKLEYFYLDLGSLNSVAPFGGVFANPFISPLAGTVAVHTHFVDNIVRVGLNYKFGN